MATASLLTFSSPPPSYQIRSVISPDAPQTGQELDTSSSQLASPSTFIKPRSFALESGSKAQPIPQSVADGFTSVGSLWKDKKLDLGTPSDEETHASKSRDESKDAANAVGKHHQGTGKLVKPKKPKGKESEQILRQNAASRDSRYENAATTAELSTSELVRPDIYDVPLKLLTLQLPEVLESGLSLSGHAFAESDEPSKARELVAGVKLAKKPRTRQTNAEKPKEVAVKKPRKRKAKSESIILNSDESWPAEALSSAQEQSFMKKGERKTQDLRAVPKPKKVPGKKAKIKSSSKAAEQVENQVSQQAGEFNASIAGPETSIYFAKQSVPDREASSAAPRVSAAAPANDNSISTAIDSIAANHKPTEIVSRRRLSWTPPKDTSIANVIHSRPPSVGSEASDLSRSPRLQLTDIVGKYNYNCPTNRQAAPDQRTPTGEAATKRRRIELTDAATISTTKRHFVVSAAPKSATGSKAPKKPQTITAVATAAFQTTKIIDAEESTTSALFAAEDQTADREGETKGIAAHQTTTGKSRKPRKPRTKPSIAADVAERKRPGTPSKKPRSRKTARKVKFSEADHRPRLHSPIRANAQIKKQDFLFGTSSQLAPAESPQFIRDMQAALRESEQISPLRNYREDIPSQASPSSPALTSPRNKSYVRVPTAPHGTCLSIEQADTHLWRAAAQGFEGGVFRPEQHRGSVVNADSDLQARSCEEPKAIALVQGDEGCELESTCAAANQRTWPLLSPESIEPGTPVPEEGRRLVYKHSDETIPDPSASSHSEKMKTVMISNGSDAGAPQVKSGTILDSHALPRSTDDMPTALSGRNPVKFASPRMFRQALYPLDSNANLFKSSPVKARAFDHVRSTRSIASDPSRDIRSPSAGCLDGNDRSKSSIKSPKASGTPTNLHFTTSSPHRPKLIGLQSGEPMSQSAAKSKWMDVDEISDSDAPTTPSPPRRCSSSPTFAVRPLPLSPSKALTSK